MVQSSAFGRMAVTFAMRFDSAKKAAIAAMSQMSSSSKPELDPENETVG
jgi:hypothetical protein